MKSFLLTALLPLCCAAKAQEILPQIIPNYGDSILTTTWLGAPVPDFRVLWNEPESRKTLRWSEVQGARLATTQTLNIPQGFSNWKFSPDASHVLGQIRTGENANQHNSRTFSFTSRRFRFVADHLFENSEIWSPDGKRVAFFRGTTDYTVGNEKPVRLVVRELASGRETLLRTPRTPSSCAFIG